MTAPTPGAPDVAELRRLLAAGSERPWPVPHQTPEGPKRIQRQRTKGWRMPEGAVYVGRPSRWGNGNVVGAPDPDPSANGAPMSAATAVGYFEWMTSISPNAETWAAPLRGHDLACWCPLDQPCHADVLLELANQPLRAHLSAPTGRTG